MLWKLNDDQLVELNGVDYTLYLVYLRYCAVLCCIFTVFNSIIMVPIYATGSPTTLEFVNWSSMNVLTLLNVTANNRKMGFAFFITILPVSACAYILLYKYFRKY